MQLILGGERDDEFTVRRAVKWTAWSAAWWLLVAGLYAIATSTSSPGWAFAMAFSLISLVIFMALVCSAFTVGYSCFLFVEWWRLRKGEQGQS